MTSLRSAIAGAIAALALAAALPAAKEARADGLRCPARPGGAAAPAIRFEVFPPHVVYHHNVDILGLPSVGDTLERAPTGHYILGLTKNPTFVRLVDFRTVNLPLGDGRYCVWVTGVTAQMGDPREDVYIAANYPEGSCEYDAVMRHENRHVAINLEGLREWVPSVRAALSEAAARRFPVIADSLGGGRQVGALLFDAVRPLFALMNEDLRRRNAAIDTPESYRATQAECSNWFPRGTRPPR